MCPPRLGLTQQFEKPVLRTFLLTLRRGNFDSPFLIGVSCSVTHTKGAGPPGARQNVLLNLSLMGFLSSLSSSIIGVKIIQPDDSLI